MTASRVSHSTSSNGWRPSLVKYRLKLRPRPAVTSRSLVATDYPFLVAGKGYSGVITTIGFCSSVPDVSSRRSPIIAGCCGNTPNRPQHVGVAPPNAKPRRRLPGPSLGRNAFLQEQPQLPLEVGQLLEVLVHAGEPHVGDLVELRQLRQHLQADVLASDLGPLATD